MTLIASIFQIPIRVMVGVLRTSTTTSTTYASAMNTVPSSGTVVWTTTCIASVGLLFNVTTVVSTTYMHCVGRFISHDFVTTVASTDTCTASVGLYLMS